MQFFEAVLIGRAHGQLVVNTLWYRRNIPTAPTTQDHDALITALTVGNGALFNLVACLHNSYVAELVRVYSYWTDFVREPYLPVERVFTKPGYQAGASAPLYNAGVVSFKLNPLVKGRRKDKNGQIIETHVRRGYLSLGPLPQACFGADGTFNPAGMVENAGGLLTNSLIVDIAHPSSTVVFEPTRVGTPLENETKRGYADVLNALWRTVGSTRRSRMKGRGA